MDDTLEHLIATERQAFAALHTVIDDTGQEPASEALEHLIMRKQDQVDVLVRASNV